MLEKHAASRLNADIKHHSVRVCDLLITLGIKWKSNDVMTKGKIKWTNYLLMCSILLLQHCLLFCDWVCIYIMFWLSFLEFRFCDGANMLCALTCSSNNIWQMCASCCVIDRDAHIKRQCPVRLDIRCTSSQVSWLWPRMKTSSTDKKIQFNVIYYAHPWG